MSVTHQKKHGIHYTPTDLAAFLAEQIVERLSVAVGDIVVLDPACGDGGLLKAFVDAMPKNAYHRLILVGYDTDREAVAEASKYLSELEVKAVEVNAADFLALAAVEQAGDGGLFAHQPVNRPLQVDAVISNPPYVRTQVLGAAEAQRLAQQFGLSGRVDLYHAFAMAMTSVLKPEGVIGLLTSNRFLVTKAGASMRKLLRDRLDLEAVFDLGDTKLFEAAVLPAIVIGRRTKERRRQPCGFARAYEARPSEGEEAPFCSSVLDALRAGRDGMVQTSSGCFRVERGHLAASADCIKPWFLASDHVNGWMEAVAANTHCRFVDVAEIRVGIKTTADNVFIREDWDALDDAQRPEALLLHPLLTHHVAQRWSLEQSALVGRKRVLYPHEVRDGKRYAIRLGDYPRARRYLEANRKRLESRTYVIEGGRNWYEIWVPQDPSEWFKAKVVCPDISLKPCFFLDRSGAIVNGDCYWMTLRPGISEDWLLLIMAVANSTFIEKFYDTRFHNKLYSGRRRFITQYTSEFPLPDISRPPVQDIIGLVQDMLATKDQDTRSRLETAIDKHIWQAFGLGAEILATAISHAVAG
ncbi:MAG: N-6 DNA methylase [Planctomycetes bacterium]|nr:N-6 DNA methylase [Planctomycetota bacterium]